MKNADEVPTYQMILIDLGNLKCKAIMLVPINSDVQLAELSNTKIQEKVMQDMIYHIGFLKKKLSTSGILLKEVEIVMPQKGQYLLLEENISNFYANQGIIVKVLTGSLVEVDYYSGEQFANDMGEEIFRFSQMITANN